MTSPEEPEPNVYAVLVPVGEECYATGHRLHPFDDAISCYDCEIVAAQAMVDGKDLDEAILAFRAWSLERAQEQPPEEPEP
ncbi:MAG: hypothetical protein M3O98_03065 [Actinomycetota bacterium]|nr:hypothetical protein [Actinomycetota bacterium]